MLFAWCFAVCCLHSSSLFVCSARVTAMKMAERGRKRWLRGDGGDCCALGSSKVLAQLICIRNPCKSFSYKGIRNNTHFAHTMIYGFSSYSVDSGIFMICQFPTTLTFLSRLLPLCLSLTLCVCVLGNIQSISHFLKNFCYKFWKKKSLWK